MRNFAKKIAGAGATLALLGGLAVAPQAFAADAKPGKAPSEDECKNPEGSAVLQGGCVVINRGKGNCMACHAIEGTALAGNIAPPLNYMKQRFPDKARLRAQIWDATAFNPNSSMPPFGKNAILTEDEIDKVVEFLMTL